MKPEIRASGLVLQSSSGPYLAKAQNIASIIDNGTGSYQFVFVEPIDAQYTCVVTGKETRDEQPVLACERNHYERSEVDFLIELKSHDAEAIDADCNFLIVGEPYG